LTMIGESLRVPGSLYVEPLTKQQGVLHVGTDVGWIAPRGLRKWSREISVVLKADVPEAVCHELGVILPDAQPVARKLPNVLLAARASKLIAVESSLVEKLLARRVRVHTVGSEGVTGGFYYFAKGGKEKPVRVQGNIFEMLALALAKSPDNAMLEECLDGLIDRLLTELSGQVLSEAQVELAGALSSLGEPSRESAARLQALEGFLVLAQGRASPFEGGARAVLLAVRRATRSGKERVELPLFGIAQRRIQPMLEVLCAEGELGARRKHTLPPRRRWFVERLMPEAEAPVLPNLFVGSVKLEPMRIVKETRRIAAAVIDILSTLPQAEVDVKLEIMAKVPSGVSDAVVRTVSENTKTLGFRAARFERE
jgi:hypothetical protein